MTFKPHQPVFLFRSLFISALFLICLWSCGYHKTKKDNRALNKVVKPKVEYIDWYSVRINGIAHTASSPKILFAAMGQPDSITTPDMAKVCGSFFDQSFKYVYIKGSEFEMRGDSIVVGKLNFNKSRINVVCGVIRLDNNTTINYIAKLFPYAVSHKYNVNDGGEKFTAVMLGAADDYKPGDTDGVWILYFKKNKLDRMEYYLDC